MNNYQVTTSQGIINFQACDSDFAVWEANKINTLGLGNSERVDLMLITQDQRDNKDFALNCGQFTLVGAETTIDQATDQVNIERDVEQICWSRMDENSGTPLPYTKEHLMSDIHASHTLCGIPIPNANDVMDITSQQSSDTCKRCEKSRKH
jgi:hypothetical protein